ncbi:exlusion protein FxsA [Bacterioplanes sanyensis]|uniref:Exlusion protein FxsA n=1 Tax=Bacterioplanes sanyensis TaxID=1249553 RepID=A0A222FKB1_9GAMM|nr:FxsA family protein [Bacterioplanes sanyensis]ASP39092.1 exlusion protein FxsA [Bacterioplanes sanyensis]
MPLFLIFVAVPIVELYVLLQVGSFIGLLPTLALVVLTAVVGVTLLKAQGLATLMRARSRLEQGSLPAKELAEGFLLALAGAMLLTPGFITDSFGFALLVPAIRSLMLGSVMKLLKPNVVVGGAGNVYEGQASSRTNPGYHSGHVIEGDYQRQGSETGSDHHGSSQADSRKD